MSFKDNLVEFSKGNDLRDLWRLYRKRRDARSGAVRSLYTYLMCRCAHKHGGYIGPGAVIEGIPVLPHGLHGIFISRYAKIGTDCRIYQNVTIGEVDGLAPTIGNGCLIGAGAIIIGDIKIGDNAKIGAGATVHTDVPAGATVVPPASRIIEKAQDDTE